jgi:hypothetical protein
MSILITKSNQFLAIIEWPATGANKSANFNYLLSLDELSSARIACAIAFRE